MKICSNSSVQIFGWVVRLALVTLLTPSVFAQPDLNCSALFAKRRPLAVPAMDLAAQGANQYASPNVAAYGRLHELRKLLPSVNAAENASLVASIDLVLKDEELSIFHLRLQQVFQTIKERVAARVKNRDFRALLATAIEEQNVLTMPRPQAVERAQTLVKTAQFDEELLLQALGGLTQRESTRALIGPSGIHNVSRDSLVGRFLEKSAALGVLTSTMVGPFASGPGAAHGAARLFISVDARTAKLAQEIFGTNPNLLIHNHKPQQAALTLFHMGKLVNFSRYNGDARLAHYDIRNGVDVHLNTIAPIITLSTTEASRAFNYFELGRLSGKANTKYPWAFKDKSTPGEEKDYCRPGGYISCTHWVGEMPIGDRMVPELTFPGQADHYGAQNDPKAVDPTALREAPVGTFTHANKPDGRSEPIGTVSREDRLTRIVWKENRSSEQFWSMLNLRDQLGRGELANPGWVLYSLLGPAPIERVPVVLIYRQNASVPLTQADLDALQGTINQY